MISFFKPRCSTLKQRTWAGPTDISLWTTEESKSLQGIATGFTGGPVRNVTTTLTELSGLIWIRLTYAVCANSATGVDSSTRHTAFFEQIGDCTRYRYAVLIVGRVNITIVWHVTSCSLIDADVSEDVLDTHSQIDPVHVTYVPNSRLIHIHRLARCMLPIYHTPG